MSDRQPLNEAAQRRRIAEPVPHEHLAPGVTADSEPMKKRRPFGSRERKLAMAPREGFHRHWFNDDPGRIERAGEAGYTHVRDPKGSNTSNVVGVSRGGGPLVAYLMEIPIEWYQEDMLAQDEDVLSLLHQIGRGDYEKPGGRDGQLQYAGSDKGGISIQIGARR